VEFAFEDSDSKTQDVGKMGDAECDLPDLWVTDEGPRFVTVYFREKYPRMPEPKAQEQPTTIIRIIPAPVRTSDEQDFDEIEAAEGPGADE
jgi:hypothetical protein